MSEQEKTKGLSKEYVLDELHHFRELMGKKSFWEDADKVELALKGMMHVWVNCRDDFSEREQLFFQSTIFEFDKRWQLIVVGLISGK